MRLIIFWIKKTLHIGFVREDEIVDLGKFEPSRYASILLAFAHGNATQALSQALQDVPAVEKNVTLAAPVPFCSKVICVGLNYADHAAETGASPPPEPVIFSKFPTAITGPDDVIRLPRVSQQVDYEAELVVVIGREGRYIPEDQAMNYVAGYTCGNDVSARDWQIHKPERQWLLGKSFDTFAPIGPWVVSKDEIPDPHNLAIRLCLNGQVMQQSNTRQFIFSIPKLIAYISQVCTLLPGDLIFTGTPGGVGFTRKPPVFLKPGDEVEVDIEKIGRLVNRVEAEA